MSKHITRRDFLNGAALSIAGAAIMGPQTALSEAVKAASMAGNDYYPPILTGIRGSQDGSFDAAHALAWRGEKPSK